MDRTLILVKPDAFARNLTGEIIARFERKGLRIAALKATTLTAEIAEQHYAEHEGKPLTDADLAKFKLPAAKVEKIARAAVTSSVIAALTESAVAELVEFLAAAEA